jgi:hypothetical protein
MVQVPQGVVGVSRCARVCVHLCMYVHVGVFVCNGENEMSECLHVRVSVSGRLCVRLCVWYRETTIYYASV